MRNLLSAGFVRLWRSKVFWLSCAVAAGISAISMLTRYLDGLELGDFESIDSGFFNFVVAVGVLSALVCTLLLGTEYGEGTLRNKLVSGHRRRDVYLASLAVCSAGSLLICAAATGAGLAVGLPLLGGFKMGTVQATVTIAGTFALSLAFAALFTGLAMLVSSRTASAVAGLLLALLLLLAGSYLNSRLEEPPTEADFVIVNGQMMLTNERDNPRYLPEGPVRQTCQFLFDFLPGGQTVQYANPDTANRQPFLLMTYDAVLFVLTTGAGLLLFKRKDLK